MFARLIPGIALLLMMASAAVACGGDDDDNGGGTTPTAAVAAATTPSSQPTTGACDTGGAEVLDAGRHASSVFQPGVSAEVGEGWINFEDRVDGWFLERPCAPEAEQGYIAVMKVTQVWNPENFSTPEPLPDSIIDWLASHRDLNVVGGPSDVTVAGIPGRSIDIRVDSTENKPLFSDYDLEFRDAARFIELRRGDDRIIIATGAFNQFYFGQLVPTLQEVIDSIQFE
jgi:hypothetical protein